MHRLGLGVLSLGLLACGDDTIDPAIADSSSSGVGHDPTGSSSGTPFDPDTSSSATSTSSGPSSSDDSSADTTAGGVHAQGSARLFYKDVDAPGGYVPVVVEIVAGELQRPVALLPPGAFVGGIERYYDERWLVITDERLGAPDETWVFDTWTAPPFEAWALDIVDAPTTNLPAQYSSATRRLAMRMRSATDDVTQLHIVTLGDDGPSDSFHATAELPENVALASFGAPAFVLGDEHVVILAADAVTEIDSLWLVPAQPGAAAPRLLVENTDSDTSFHAPIAIPGSTLVLFGSEDAETSIETQHVVDLVAMPPVALSIPMLAQSQTTCGATASPDGSGFVVCEEHDGERDLSWVRIADALPQTPVQLDVGAGDVDVYPIDSGFSADGRWFGYSGGAVWERYVVELADGIASEPYALVDEPQPSLARAAHGDDVYVGIGTADAPRLARVSLAGEVPSQPEIVVDSLDGIVRWISIARDGNTLAYVTDDGSDRHAYWIDLTGELPATPTAVATMGEMPGPTSTLALRGAEYVEYGLETGGAGLVDLVSAQAFVLADGRSVANLFELGSPR